MNIFKILTSGDGVIHEPSISAFLAYLLNPREDHGLGDSFLRKFLLRFQDADSHSCFYDDDNNLRNLSSSSKFEFEILLEQAFQLKKKNKIVDIVILCFLNEQGKSQSLAKKIIAENNRGSLEQVILIENKIREEGVESGQLTGQVKATVNTLNKIISSDSAAGKLSDKLSYIFLSRKGGNAGDVFGEFEKDNVNLPKTHVVWESTDNLDGVVDYIEQILDETGSASIDPANNYVLDTLRAFKMFVGTGFKSLAVERAEGGGAYKKDLKDTLDEFLPKYGGIFNAEFTEKLVEITKFVNTKFSSVKTRHSKTHALAVMVPRENSQDRKIIGLTRKSDGVLTIHIQLRYFGDLKKNRSWWKRRFKKLGVGSDRYLMVGGTGFVVEVDDVEVIKELFSSHFELIDSYN